MRTLTIFPADLTELSVSQLAALPPQQLHEADANLDHLIAWAQTARSKLDAALAQHFGEYGNVMLPSRFAATRTATLAISGDAP